MLPKYEYEVFISYRHNDNLPPAGSKPEANGWVSEFVINLQKELRATVKEPVRIYFDNDPKDGLRENHLVDETLGEKINSFILVPIISQTYCDPNSFAWKGEFIPFRQQSLNDDYGPNVRLRNGNVVGRVLPVKIHDLDPQDGQLLETELSGVLRSIDFIYSEGGVNRSLRESDDELLSGNYQLLYRNQINKVANAIKDMLVAVKNPAPLAREATERTTQPDTPQPVKVSPPTIPGIEEMSENQKTVFLAWTSADLRGVREELALILEKAGFNVLPATDCPSDDEAFKKSAADNLARADISLHVLSGEYGRRFELEDELSYPRHQFNLARDRAAEPDDPFKLFKLFIWYHPAANVAMKPMQKEFINEIRQTLSDTMMMTNAPSAIQLVDDMRAAVVEKQTADLDRKDTDIFFIYSEDDELEADFVSQNLSQEHPIELLNVFSDSQDEYKEISRQQIEKSKLAVVYFKYSADWALPFVKEMWREMGGAKSPTSFMLVGEDPPRTNSARKFMAPRVFCSVLPKEAISDEVKKVFKNVNKT